MTQSCIAVPVAGKQYRHEIKLLLTSAEYLTLSSRIRALLAPDEHMSKPEGYLISSLYLEDAMRSAYYEKLSGIAHRRKYRVRIYENSDAFIRLEKKEKAGDQIAKSGTGITREMLEQLMCGNIDEFAASEHALCREVASLAKARGLAPYVIVRYLREAYVHPLSNVRITFDKEITAGVNSLDLFDTDTQYSCVFPHGNVVLEVKYDEYFPKLIAQCIAGFGSKLAVSKYVYCADKKQSLFH